MQALILSVLIFLQGGPNPNWGESRATYQARLATIADAIAESTKDREVALAVAAVFYYESRFSPHVHSGAERGKGKGRSVCLGQHQRLKRTETEWLALAGVDPAATLRCAKATVTTLTKSLLWCQKRHVAGSPEAGWQGAFSLYATGKRCTLATRGIQGILTRAEKHSELIREFAP